MNCAVVEQWHHLSNAVMSVV